MSEDRFATKALTLFSGHFPLYNTSANEEDQR